MTKPLSFTERYFPPLGAVPLGTPATWRQEPSWLPLHLLLAQLGRCSGCENPAAYILASAPSERPDEFACVPVCDTHVCELAGQTEAGHQLCPKCHIRWCADPAITPEFLAPVLTGEA